MKKLGLNEIREKYLAFFESKGHLRLPSFPLVPENDPSLLLIPAGMAPLKPYFMGELTPPSKRVTTCQKCIRTNDIENVGLTARHLTFFEMLGNFSFGDYFKPDATKWAWEFVTDVLGMPKERLYVSIFEEDDEARDIWINHVGVDPDHVFKMGRKDNFWEIGTGSGPCGPCSEIYFDRGEKYSCGPDCHPGCDCDRFVEFWNLVFTQYNNDGNGNYLPLEHKNIDTGMGLERIACIMQEVDSLFEVDTMTAITDKVSEICGKKRGVDPKTDVSLRIITDHIRSTVMLVCDGVIPSNEGRGYVLRRLIRRAARHGRLLGIPGEFLTGLCDIVFEVSGSAYPQIVEKSEYIRQVVHMEEERFAKTIDSGLVRLGDMIAALKAEGKSVLSGEDAFKLYDTYGFPVDLTVEILGEQDLTLDRPEFDEQMQAQRERARAARGRQGGLGWAEGSNEFGAGLQSEFTGYTSFENEAKLLAIAAEGEEVGGITAGMKGTLILDRTPFYAESGGQVADHGVILAGNARFIVDDVQKTADGRIFHFGTLESGELKIGEALTAKVDTARRKAIMRAHSATHLVQKALRNTLGTHVEQAGSLVEPDKLRFDFSHFAALTSDELSKIEREVNESIMEGYDINIREMPIAEAKKLGAMSLFGEKYGDVVRVVRMGDYSTELCGGTHLDNTAKVGPFKILSESSIAAGVRRIEAKVGNAFLEEFEDRSNLVYSIADLLKTTPSELDKRVRQILEETKSLRKELDNMRTKEAISSVEKYLVSAKNVGGLKVIASHVGDVDVQTLRSMGDWLNDKEPAVVAVFASTLDGKVTFLAVCGKDAIKHGMHAGNLVREVCKAAGGSGGGKPDSAMGGGKDLQKVDNALAVVDDYVVKNVKE